MPDPAVVESAVEGDGGDGDPLSSGLEEQEVAIASHRVESESAEFDWGQFAEIVRPYWKLLIIAAGVSSSTNESQTRSGITDYGFLLS